MVGAVTGRGETLVEVTISLLVLAVGAMALAAGITRAGVDRRHAQEAARSAIAAESWLERWRAGATSAGDNAGAGVVALENPAGRLLWRVERSSACVLEATVEAATDAGRVTARLASRRFVEGDACGP